MPLSEVVNTAGLDPVIESSNLSAATIGIGGYYMEVNKIEEKKCSKCGKLLPLTEFYSKGNGKYRSECKECHKNYVKDKY